MNWDDISQETDEYKNMVAIYVKSKNLFKNGKAIEVYYDNSYHYIYIHIFKSISELGILGNKFTLSISPESLYDFATEYNYKEMQKKLPSKIETKTKRNKI